MKSYLIEVGKKVRQAREAKGLYLRDVGDLCNLDYSNICRLELGQQDVRLSTLKNIADVLKVDVKDFL